MNRRALKILMDAYWSSAGWKPEGAREPSAEDFAFAKSHGFMFDREAMDHAGVQRRLEAALRELDRRRVADAFLASLSTRRLDWRSVLGSYAVFQHMPEHTETGLDGDCEVCGLSPSSQGKDLNVLNFERWKWGGVRHDQVVYAMFDMEQFLRDPAPPPSSEDVRIFRSLVESIRSAPTETTSARLQACFPKGLKSYKAERDIVVGLLGYCGVLGTSDHPGYGDSYVPPAERQLPDRRFVDMSYPACWWNAGHGVNEACLSDFFGHVL